MICIMETSDILWTSNANIRKKYGGYFERSYVMDIPVNIQEIKRENDQNNIKNKDVVKVCFAGSSDHIHMVDKMLSPAINHIAEKYSKEVYFYIIGVKPQKIKESNNVKIVEYFNNIQDYYDFVKKSKIDIGLAPLEASDFTACKYYNKFLDYTCNGMVGIYSDVEPYKLIVKSEFNGMLAKNEERSWEELLEKLILSKKLREKIYFNAVKEVKEKFTQPPKHFTEDTLLKSMEIAGNDALEKGVEVERKGLGTPATRAGIIENLIFKGFVERDKKNLVATHKGISLVTILSDSFKSAETTAKWEMELSDIAQGKSSKEEFLEEIENEIKEVVLTYIK